MKTTMAGEPGSDAAAAEKAEPGVIVTFSSLRAGAAQPSFADSRLARLLALNVPKGTAPSPFTPPGPFKATFEGDINLRLRTFLVFSAAGRGRLTLKIGEQSALDLSGEFAGKASERIRLGKGKNHFIAVYESPADDNAAVRVFWSSSTFTPEPIPPIMLSHSIGATGLAESLHLRNGRFLLADFRCTRCHAAPVSADPGSSANGAQRMPELAMDAPSLADIGGRLSAKWMAAWINNPRALRPGSHMPRLFEAADRNGMDARACDAAAYLASLGKAASPAGASDPSAVKAGGQLFARLNCIGCHTLPDVQSADPQADAQRVPLRHVRAKFLPGALRAYLVNPQAHYSWNPMPNFRLSDGEATAIAAYLESFDGTMLPECAAGDAVRGREVVRSSGCLACHSLGEEKSAMPAALVLAAISRDGWTRGCMSQDSPARKAAPDFGLSDEQRGDLAAFAKTDRASLNQDAVAEFAERQIQSLRCTACHARDGAPSLLASSLESELTALEAAFPSADAGAGETFAADQRAPMLTWAGEKLRPDWMAHFIAGQIGYKPRPHLRARMPSFAARADQLARGLASQHGYSADLPPEPPPDAALAVVGRKLTGRTPNQSLGCVQCHSAGTQPALAPFGAPAPNFNHVTERLRKDYYFRWVHDPLRIDPETKMPRFDDANGKTGIVNVFDGDAHQQFEAIWQYFLQGAALQPAE